MIEGTENLQAENFTELCSTENGQNGRRTNQLAKGKKINQITIIFLIKKFCESSARSASNRRFRKFSARILQFLTLYDRGNGITPSGELYGALLHGERAERAQNK